MDIPFAFSLSLSLSPSLFRLTLLAYDYRANGIAAANEVRMTVRARTSLRLFVFHLLVIETPQPRVHVYIINRCETFDDVWNERSLAGCHVNQAHCRLIRFRKWFVTSYEYFKEIEWNNDWLHVSVIKRIELIFTFKYKYLPLCSNCKTNK